MWMQIAVERSQKSLWIANSKTRIRTPVFHTPAPASLGQPTRTTYRRTLAQDSPHGTGTAEQDLPRELWQGVHRQGLVQGDKELPNHPDKQRFWELHTRFTASTSLGTFKGLPLWFRNCPFPLSIPFCGRATAWKAWQACHPSVAAGLVNSAQNMKSIRKRGNLT